MKKYNGQELVETTDMPETAYFSGNKMVEAALDKFLVDRGMAWDGFHVWPLARKKNLTRKKKKLIVNAVSAGVKAGA
jgi:hypothetical protein